MIVVVRWEGKLFSLIGNVVSNSKRVLEIEVVLDSGKSDLCKFIKFFWEFSMFYFFLGMF